MTNAISLLNVSKHYRENENDSLATAVDSVSLTIAARSITGIVGKNGCGKSTLLKMIAGIIKPSAGQIETHGHVLALTDVGAGFHPDLTGRENIYMVGKLYGLNTRQIDQLYPQVEEFSEMKDFMDTRVKNYSQGMFLRLAFGLMIHLPLDIVLIDEVLGVGDEVFRLKCYSKIKMLSSKGLTIVFVSHSFEEIAALCTRCIVLEKGKIIADGSPENVYNNYSKSLHTGTNNDSKLSFQVITKGIIKMESVKVENATNAQNQIDFASPISIIIHWEKCEAMGTVFFDLLLSDRVGNPFFATANFYDSQERKDAPVNSGTIGSFKTVFTLPPFFLNYGMLRLYLNASVFYDSTTYVSVLLTETPLFINILNAAAITEKQHWLHSPAPIKTKTPWVEEPA